LSVENYQINEERASKGPSRFSTQMVRGPSAYMYNIDQPANAEHRQSCKRRASHSAASSINYSETLDNDIMAQHVNGQMISMPGQYFYQQ